jgi:hypothetical protein
MKRKALCRPVSLPLSPAINCNPEWEEIFNFHYAGMTGIDYTSLVLRGTIVSFSISYEIASSSTCPDRCFLL